MCQDLQDIFKRKGLIFLHFLIGQESLDLFSNFTYILVNQQLTEEKVKCCYQKGHF